MSASVSAVSSAPSLLMPAEWAPHDATWIAWPHHEPDWPGKLGAVMWVYAEIVRALAAFEPVHILCHDERVRDEAQRMLAMHAVSREHVHLHVQKTDRVWLRDSGPTGVHRADGSVALVHWGFDAWSKYDNFALDERVPGAMARVTGLPLVPAVRGGTANPLILEGGGIETDGAGTLLVTEEWLLSDVQVRNPGFTRADYERAFGHYLGITQTIWLGEGCVGDDTHGHVDDVARFVAPGVVVLAHERDPADENHERSLDNLHRLARAHDAGGTPLRVIELPFPRAVVMDGIRLPASYANFYVANGTVLVPTFNDANDRVALDTLAGLFPDRRVVGIHSVDLVWGLGTLHCLTQQQPSARGVVSV